MLFVLEEVLHRSVLLLRRAVVELEVTSLHTQLEYRTESSSCSRRDHLETIHCVSVRALDFEVEVPVLAILDGSGKLLV